MGLNADLLGMSGQQGGSGMNAPGITVQMRQKQGLAAVQSLFDNLSGAKRALGNYMIKMIVDNFTPEKITRITNKPLPQAYSAVSSSSRYDCEVEEAPNTPTYRAYQMMLLLELLGKNIPIPPEMLLQASDLPQDFKEKLLQNMQQQQQQQAAIAQQQSAREQQMMENERFKLMLEAERVKIEAMKAAAVLGRSEADAAKKNAQVEEILAGLDDKSLDTFKKSFNLGKDVYTDVAGAEMGASEGGAGGQGLLGILNGAQGGEPEVPMTGEGNV
jgi:hypothetical protein